MNASRNGGRRFVSALAVAASFYLGACSKPPEQLKRELIAKIELETGKKSQTTPSGLTYIMLAEGAGESPKLTDRVRVEYTGKLLNGKKFDSSKDSDKPAIFPLSRLIKGWVEGIGMMKPGGKAIMIVPPELGYGTEEQEKIPANSTLVFEVELVGIES